MLKVPRLVLVPKVCGFLLGVKFLSILCVFTSFSENKNANDSLVDSIGEGSPPTQSSKVGPGSGFGTATAAAPSKGKLG